MNTLMLVALAVVALCYCGGKYCPSVLKQNKELVLGVLVGMALCSFAGLKLEGWLDGTTMDEKANTCCDGGDWKTNKRSVGPNHQPNECAMDGSQDDLNGMCERLILTGQK